MSKLKPRIIAVVLALIVAGMVQPALADTRPHFILGSTIALVDRTGDPRIQAGLDHALSVWNGIANFTLVIQQGPLDNNCAPAGEDAPNTIGICTYTEGSNGNYGRYPYYYADGSNSNATGLTKNGYAGQCTNAPCVGIADPANVRRILVHEIGHVLGLDHTGVDAGGRCSIMSIDCYSEVPNDIDRAQLQEAYGQSGPTTTTTVPQTTTTILVPATTRTTTNTTLGTTTTTTTPPPASTTTTGADPTCTLLAALYQRNPNPAYRAAIRQQQVVRLCPIPNPASS